MDLRITNAQGKGGKIIFAYNVTHEQALPAENTLTFTTKEDLPDRGRVYISAKQGTGAVHEFIITRQERTHGENFVSCESALYELYGDFIEDKRPRASSADRALSVALRGTRWSVKPGNVRGVFDFSFYRTSVREAIQQILNKTGAELEEVITIDGDHIKREIQLVEKRGLNRFARFEYGKNLAEVRKTTDAGDIITALYGFGRGEETEKGFGRRLDFASVNAGAMYVANDEARAQYGIQQKGTGELAHVFGIRIYQDIEDPEELKKATEKDLAEFSKPRIRYEAKAIYKAGSVALGDTVQVIDDEVGRIEGRITRIRTGLDTLQDNEIEITTRESIQEVTERAKRQILSEVGDKAGAWDKKQKFNLDDVEGLIEKFNNDINAGLSRGKVEYYSGGIRFIDESGNKAVEIGTAGIRLANKKGSDGRFIWTTLGTGDGLAAGSVSAVNIQAGAINADHLQAGVIRSEIGDIGGFTLRDGYMDAENENKRLQIGGEGEGWFLYAQKKPEETPRFSVSWDGTLTAKDADIEGNIKAESGQIADFHIENGILVSDNEERRLQIGAREHGYFLYAGEKAAGDSVFSVDWDGRLLAKDATLSGTINAQRGTIGGFDINGGILKSENSDRTLQIGTEGTGWFLLARNKYNNDKEFAVDWDGKLFAKDANISGTIRAHAGLIAGFDIHDHRIESKNEKRELMINNEGEGWFLLARRTGDETTFGVDWNGDMTCRNATIQGRLIRGTTADALEGKVHEVGGTVRGLGGSISYMGGSVLGLSGTADGLEGSFGDVRAKTMKADVGTLGLISYSYAGGMGYRAIRFHGGVNADSMYVDSSIRAGSANFPSASIGTLTYTTLRKTSDRRRKTNISAARGDLKDVVYNLRLKEFEYKRDKGAPQIGIIAQELIEQLPRDRQRLFIQTDNEGMFSVNYENLFISALSAIQDLNERVKTLESKLEKRNSSNG